MKNKLKTSLVLVALILVCLIFGSCSSYFLSDSRSIKSTDINELGELIIYYTDGTFENLGVVVGKEGEQGAQGVAGNDGKDGKDGANGKDGIDGKDGVNGADGSITIIDGSSTDATQIAISKCLLNSVSIGCTFTKIENGLTSSYGSSGSGVIYKINKEAGEAIIVTNQHVVYDSESITSNGISPSINVYLYGLEYSNFAIEATYIGGSANYDIAVLKVTNSDIIKNSDCSSVTIRDSSTVCVGEETIAIGNPMGEGIAATTGILSVDSEEIDMKSITGTGSVTHRVMRVDTPINPGNSGGGLFDSNGNLIGIVNAKNIESDVENVGYAIPSSIAIGITENILYYCDGVTSTAPMRALLGISVGLDNPHAEFDASTGKTFIVEDVVVHGVNSDSVAKDILCENDILKSVSINDGEAIQLTRQFMIIDALLYAHVGDTVNVTYLNSNQEECNASFVITESMLQEYP
ncbi:MAG: trypsin-like peptidase domain-containing protein [Clostridia bacterium]|nr:trypsin-like peptidase domain-containing protein [Clostridia bacterium]